MLEKGLAVASEWMKDTLSPHTEEDARLLQKGMLLYRQGMVSQLRRNENTVAANVQDVVPVRVQLELDYMEMSQCSCPAQGICRHQIAVFFSLYSRSRSVAEWIEDWRFPVREKKAAAEWGLQKARDLVKMSGVVDPDYKKWIESFEEGFTSIMRSKKHLSPYVISELFSMYWRRIEAGSPSGNDWHNLYQLTAIIYSFRELARLGVELGHTAEMVERYYLHVFEQLEEDGIRTAAKISNLAQPLAFDPFLRALREDVRGLLTVVPWLIYERTFLYMGLWTVLFKKRAWVEEEFSLISEAAESLDEEADGLPLVIASIHLHILLKNDTEALDSLSMLDDEAGPPFMLYWIDQMNGQKEWNRIGPYLELLAQKLKGALTAVSGYQGRSQFVRNVLEAAAPFVEETGRSDLFEKFLQQSLPYSYYEYGNLLFERGEYAKWADLQAFMGYQYTDLPTARLKVLEKEMPETVMSMLHQAASRQIATKNRSGYKSAVRMLKKLRTLYKKQKRVNEWEAFFEALLERNKRLRAFHEECQRSKLIDVQ